MAALYAHVEDYPDFLVGIDAWWTEPSGQGRFQPEYPFLKLHNALGSPHNSTIVPNIWSTAVRQAAENVARYIMGEKVTGVVQREDYT